jgi:hypothetical protein
VVVRYRGKSPSVCSLHAGVSRRTRDTPTGNRMRSLYAGVSRRAFRGPAVFRCAFPVRRGQSSRLAGLRLRPVCVPCTQGLVVVKEDPPILHAVRSLCPGVSRRHSQAHPLFPRARAVSCAHPERDAPGFIRGRMSRVIQTSPRARSKVWCVFPVCRGWSRDSPSLRSFPSVHSLRTGVS